MALEPAKLFNRRTPGILFLPGNKITENIMLGRWKSELVIRKGDINFNDRRYFREIDHRGVFHLGEKSFVTVTSGNKGTSIYVNGKLAEAYPDYALLKESQCFPHTLIMGNSTTGHKPWTGIIFGAALYTRTLTAKEVEQNYLARLEHGRPDPSTEKTLLSLYLFDRHHGTTANDNSGNSNNLIIPKTFRAPEIDVLLPPWRIQAEKQKWLTDIVINLIGFMPLGFFITAYLYGLNISSCYSVYLMTILPCGAISLSIELLQIYLQTRTSSLLDLICNTTGTALGCALYRATSSYFKPADKG
ncbi:MAG: hypothetical protein GY941_21435 [Planctomycetes bacterium]|nr:hypothetical protein [Planctomycetota bacterium]